MGESYTEEERFADESAFIKTATALGISGRKELLLPLPHRRSYIEYVKGTPDATYWSTPEGQAERAYWQSQEGQDAFNSINGASDLLRSFTALIEQYSDTSTIACLVARYGSLRDFFETSSPTTQCANTIRGVQPNNTVCWICGTKITGYPGAGPFSALELQPECEHVFPIAQALCFAGLYDAQLYKQIAEREGKTAAEAYRIGVSYEYQWAHRICNQLKNDTHYIRYDGTTFFIDDALLDSFLQNLQTTTKYGGGPLLMKWVEQELNLSPSQWIVAARNTMRAISQRLIEFASTSGLTPEQHAKVTLMAVRSYIATSPECAGAVERIPDAIAIRGRPGTQLSPLTMSAPVDTAKHFIAVVTETITATLQLSLNKAGRSISAQQKGVLSSYLPDAGLVLREKLETAFTYRELSGLRLKLLYFLKENYGQNVSSQKAWSEFQVAISQIVPGAIYVTAIQDGRIVMKSTANDPAFAEFLDSPLAMSDLTTLRDGVLAKIRAGGVRYEAIMRMDPNTDPRPEIPNPAWFEVPPTVQSGGGEYPTTFTLVKGGLQRRRPLYLKHANDASAGVSRRGLYEGLRERTWPRHTYRLQQHSRKSQTRRQRKHLDRL